MDRVAGRIALLPDELANQIAAGEVVERPASVVKELVENSLDAGPSEIQVSIEGGGRLLIEVRDDGHGMSAAEARLAIERHATSKLRVAADLFNITTLGFRGEALPSIASVSRLCLLTRRVDDLEGCAIEVEGGKLVQVRPAACPAGTTVIVRDLFYNTPARLKFLKTENTERRNITETMMRLALSRNDIYLRLISDGRTLLEAPPTSDLRERVATVLGRREAGHMFPVTADERHASVVVSGLLSAPQAAKRNTSGIHTFVNGRFVRDRRIQTAVSLAYAGLLEKGLFPLVVLNISIPPEEVDVNVHPTKIEVRFSQPDMVFRAVRGALLDTLANTPWVPRRAATPARTYRLMPFDESDSNKLHSSLAPSRKLPDCTESERSGLGAPSRAESTKQALSADQPDAREPPELRLVPPDRPALSALVGVQQTLPGTQRSTPDSAELGGWWTSGVGRGSIRREVGSGSNYFSSLTPIGQLGSTYLVCEDRDGMVVIDQHAAHERITFERLRDTYAGHHRQIQTLLLPIQVELDRLQVATLEEHADFLRGCGFELDPFAADAWVIRAVPAVLVGSQYERLITDVLDELRQSGHSQRMDEAVDAVLSRMACHASVRGGDRLNRESQEALLAQMDHIDFKANCPHGRPVYFTMSWSALEQRFDRQ